MPSAGMHTRRHLSACQPQQQQEATSGGQAAALAQQAGCRHPAAASIGRPVVALLHAGLCARVMVEHAHLLLCVAPGAFLHSVVCRARAEPSWRESYIFVSGMTCVCVLVMYCSSSLVLLYYFSTIWALVFQGAPVFVGATCCARHHVQEQLPVRLSVKGVDSDIW